MEAKAAHTGTPADLFKPLSVFANRAGGGILLFGLDEDASFKAVSVGNPRKLQEDLSGLAAQMEPPLRPSFSVEEIDGILHPTLAGLLMFGVYPQIFELQLFIAYLQFYGTTTTEEAPSGERFLDNRKF